MTNAWKTYSEKEKQEVMDFNDAYIDFISKGKTERLCTKMIIELAKGFGYKNMEDVILHHENAQTAGQSVLQYDEQVRGARPHWQ